MTNIFEKYEKITDEEKADLEDLYIVHQIFKQVNSNKDLELTNSELEMLYDKTKKCLELSNINCKELMTRIFEMLKCVDINIYNINDLEIEELLELLSKEDTDFKDIDAKKEIIFAINTNRFYCFLLKCENRYLLVCEKDDGTQYHKKFRSLNDLAYYISRKFLQEYGEIYI